MKNVRCRDVRGQCAVLPWIAVFCAAVPLLPTAAAQIQAVNRKPPPNVLVFVGDDIGADMVPCYGLAGDLPATPTLDSLAAAGVWFQNAWCNPLCSSTRACLQTGRHAFRTGVGSVLQEGEPSLDLAEVTLAEMLALGSRHYRSAAFGKWHLSGADQGGALGPNLQGYEFFSGTLFNINCEAPYCPPPTPYDYYCWPRVQNGKFSVRTGYATTETVDAALSWLRRTPEPWFCCVNFNAPHAPFQKPPDHLYTTDLSGAGPGNLRPLYKAAIEAMDAEMGRLLAGLDPAVLGRTTVMFLGDNGDPTGVAAPPLDPERCKGTLYQGGIRIPWIVAGARVSAPGSACAALVSTTDLFATVAELAEVDLGATLPQVELDSVSVVPYLEDPSLPSQRTTVFAEYFSPNGNSPVQHQIAMRDDQFKLIRTVVGGYDPYGAAERFFDLQNDPHELYDLLQDPLGPEAQARYDALDQALAALGYGY